MTTAQEYEQRVQESFDRCDTDGFVSQWANGLMAQKSREEARIEGQDGQDWFKCLWDNELGQRVNAKLINGKFGLVWMILDSESEDRYGRKFVPTGNKSRVQKQLGLEERQELAPARVKLESNGTGLSGSAWVVVYRADGK